VHVAELPHDAMGEQFCSAALHCCHCKLVAAGAQDAVKVMDEDTCGYLTEEAIEQ
jgi:hypothetical protein